MSFLTGKQQPATTASPLLGSTNPITGLDPTGNIPSTYASLFQQSLAPTLAQAKESVGNLTGSSLGNVTGAAAGRSMSDFLLSYLNQAGGRATQLAQQPLGYQPGFLDYLFQGLSSSAPLLAKLPMFAAAAA